VPFPLFVVRDGEGERIGAAPTRIAESEVPRTADRREPVRRCLNAELDDATEARLLERAIDEDLMGLRRW